MTKNEICIIIPYFGKFPVWMDLFIESCRMNSKIDFIFFTDDESINKYSTGNIEVHNMKFGDMKDLIKKRLHGVLPTPYKLCDYKPCYGFLFKEFMEEYLYWGHCDVDVILGDVMATLESINYKKFDRIFQWAHFSLYKNTRYINTLFQEKVYGTPPIADFDFVRKTAMPCTFDEIGMLLISIQNNVSFYRENVSFDASYSIDAFAPARVFDYNRYIVQYDNGKIYGWRLRNDVIEKKEFMYVHFQKRKLKKNDVKNNSTYIICHTGFWKSPSTINKSSIMRFVPDKPRLLACPLGFSAKSPISKIFEIIKRDIPHRRLMALHTVFAMIQSNRWKKKHLKELWSAHDNNEGWELKNKES